MSSYQTYEQFMEGKKEHALPRKPWTSPREYATKLEWNCFVIVGKVTPMTQRLDVLKARLKRLMAMKVGYHDLDNVRDRRRWTQTAINATQRRIDKGYL